MSVDLYGQFELEVIGKNGKKIKWVQNKITKVASKLVNNYLLRNMTDYGREYGDILSKKEVGLMSLESKKYFAQAVDFRNSNENLWTKEFELVEWEPFLKKKSISDYQDSFKRLKDCLDLKFYPIVLKYNKIPWDMIEWEWDFWKNKDSYENVADYDRYRDYFENLEEAKRKQLNPSFKKAVKEFAIENEWSIKQIMAFSSNIVMCDENSKGRITFFIEKFSNSLDVKYVLESYKKIEDKFIDGLVGACVKVYKPVVPGTLPYELDSIHCLTEKDFDEMYEEQKNLLEKIKKSSSVKSSIYRGLSDILDVLIDLKYNPDNDDEHDTAQYLKDKVNDFTSKYDEYDEEYVSEITAYVDELSHIKRMISAMKNACYNKHVLSIRFLFQIS